MAETAKLTRGYSAKEEWLAVVTGARRWRPASRPVYRELGRGGMATVYLAHDLKHDRKVAVKVLKPELAAVLGVEAYGGFTRRGVSP